MAERSGSRWGCVNCFWHDEVQWLFEPSECKAPWFVKAFESAIRWLIKRWHDFYGKLPPWCWVDKCKECKIERVPGETICYDCYMAKQWADYNAMITDGMRASGRY